MNCQKFESVAADLARGQMMEAEVLGDAQTHRAQCPRCTSRLSDEEMLTRGLHSLAGDMNLLEAPASIEARLLGAFRQPQVVVPLSRKQPSRRYWLTAVAALFLIVLGLAVYSWRRSETPKDKFAAAPVGNQKEIAPTPIPEQANEVTVQSDNGKGDKSKPRRRPHSSFNPRALQAKNGAGNSRNSNILNHASNEIATEFMPLGYLNASSLRDGGQIVRVEVPRTTMASFGIPVNMDRYNERVKADVLLGVDGVAHAIRFVQEKKVQ